MDGPQAIVFFVFPWNPLLLCHWSTNGTSISISSSLCSLTVQIFMYWCVLLSELLIIRNLHLSKALYISAVVVANRLCIVGIFFRKANRSMPGHTPLLRMKPAKNICCTSTFMVCTATCLCLLGYKAQFCFSPALPPSFWCFFKNVWRCFFILMNLSLFRCSKNDDWWAVNSCRRRGRRF